MFNKLYGMMNWPLIEGIEYTDIDNPHDILGPHLTDEGLLIQAFIPDAQKVQVKCSAGTFDMFKMDDEGFYAILIDTKTVISYKIIATYGDDNVKEYVDPYAFDVTTAYKELNKYNAGILYNAYEFLGSHKTTINKIQGVMFRVWAPEALRVSVVGEFNNWDGRIHQMTKVDDTDVFEIFIPELSEGLMYKYEIKKKGYENVLRADPFAFKMEEKPGDASIIASLDNYKWNDDEWIKNRSTFDVNTSPVSIYELNIATFSKNKDGMVNYKGVARDVAEYVQKMGYTHVEIMPIAEYNNDASLGYDVDYFYAPTNRYGSIDDLMEFVDIMHKNGIGVILDWVVNQYATDDAGLNNFDGSCAYGHSDPKRGVNPRNGALLFNYGRPEVSNYLISNAFMWIEKYHIDGFKLVNTASMLYLDYDRKPGEWIINILGGNEDLEAIEFMKHFNSIVHGVHKGIFTIADDNSGFPEVTGEVSEVCVGFDLKTNTSWRKDFLEFMSNPPYLRNKHYNDLSLSMVYQYSDNFVIGYPDNEFTSGNPSLVSRMVGDNEEMKFNNTKLALAYTFVHPGKKVLFMGQDMAQYSEWLPNGTMDLEILNIDKHKNVNNMIKALNKIYKEEKALYELDNSSEGFEWINNISANECVLTFIRKGTNPEDILVVVCNFEAVDRENYKIGVPAKGKYKEIFSTDSTEFGGKGFVNSRLKQSKTDECDGREDSIRINIPSLSVSIFKYSKADEKIATNKEAKDAVNAKTTSKKTAKTPKKVVASKKEEAAPKKVTAAKKEEAAPKKETVAKKEKEASKKETAPKKEEASPKKVTAAKKEK